jgi:hypothetical protein
MLPPLVCPRGANAVLERPQQEPELLSVDLRTHGALARHPRRVICAWPRQEGNDKRERTEHQERSGQHENKRAEPSKQHGAIPEDRP